jgi:hypothetical protein
MPINSKSAEQTCTQSDVDALFHCLTRWAHYPVPTARAWELATEFTQLNASVQTGAADLRFDEEPSAFAVWLNSSAMDV